MPNYVYHCPECGGEFEKLRSIEIKDIENIGCPFCGAKAELKISLVNHTFGWRLTEKSHEKGQKDELEPNV